MPGSSGYGLVAGEFFDPELRLWNPFEPAFVLACSTANMCMNVVVASEMYFLLRDSHGRKRRDPPSERRVAIQAMAVFIWSVVVFSMRFCIQTQLSEKITANFFTCFFFMISAGIPILVLGFICFLIWHREYMPSIGGRMRELSLFYGRIVFIFLLIWLPGILLVSVGGDPSGPSYLQDSKEQSVSRACFCIGLLLCSLQPTISTSLAMRKPDVKAAIYDLLKPSFFRRSR